jgi:hypothetical protein
MKDALPVAAIALAALAVSFVGCVNVEGRGAVGRYQLSSADANSVWRIDTQTGAVSLCASSGADADPARRGIGCSSWSVP